MIIESVCGDEDREEMKENESTSVFVDVLPTTKEAIAAMKTVKDG